MELSLRDENELDTEEFHNSTSGIYLYCNTVTFYTPDVSALFCNYLSTYNALPAVTATGLITAAVPFATTATTTSPALSATKTTSASPVAASGPPTSVNKKAIIGGVVGGVLGLALVVGLVFLFLVWRNSKTEDEPAPTKVEKGNVVTPNTTSPTPSEVAVNAKGSKSVSFH